MNLTMELDSPARTAGLGRQLGGMAEAGDIYTLSGPLGAGKTALAQAIGRGLGVPADCYITSPTFSLLHEYPGRLPMYHLDLYRLEDEEEVELLGFEDMIYGGGLTVIEWPDRLGGLLPPERLEIELKMISPTARRALLTVHGRSWKKRLAELAAMV